MKKWLIFAAVAAMFAVVMFPACETGGDGDGVADSVNVEAFYDHIQVSGAYPAGTKIVAYNITWEGVPGYDYYVYYEVMDARGEIQASYLSTAFDQVKGQTVYKFAAQTTPTTTGGNVLNLPYVKSDLADGKESWSILACAEDGGPDEVTAAGGSGGYSGDVILPASDGEHGATAAANLWQNLLDVFDKAATVPGSEVAQFRIAVVPANPGGYPFEEQRTVKYSDWVKAVFDADGDLITD
jgi:hypothetical protein